MDRVSTIAKLQKDIKASNEAYTKQIIQHMKDMYQSGTSNDPLIDLDNDPHPRVPIANAIYFSPTLAVVGKKEIMLQRLLAISKTSGSDALSAQRLLDGLISTSPLTPAPKMNSTNVFSSHTSMTVTSLAGPGFPSHTSSIPASGSTPSTAASAAPNLPSHTSLSGPTPSASSTPSGRLGAAERTKETSSYRSTPFTSSASSFFPSAASSAAPFIAPSAAPDPRTSLSGLSGSTPATSSTPSTRLSRSDPTEKTTADKDLKPWELLNRCFEHWQFPRLDTIEIDAEPTAKIEIMFKNFIKASSRDFDKYSNSIQECILHAETCSKTVRQEWWSRLADWTTQCIMSELQGSIQSQLHFQFSLALIKKYRFLEKRGQDLLTRSMKKHIRKICPAIIKHNGTLKVDLKGNGDCDTVEAFSNFTLLERYITDDHLLSFKPEEFGDVDGSYLMKFTSAPISKLQKSLSPPDTLVSEVFSAAASSQDLIEDTLLTIFQSWKNLHSAADCQTFKASVQSILQKAQSAPASKNFEALKKYLPVLSTLEHSEHDFEFKWTTRDTSGSLNTSNSSAHVRTPPPDTALPRSTPGTAAQSQLEATTAEIVSPAPLSPEAAPPESAAIAAKSTLYDALRVDKNASSDEINEAYKLRRRLPPNLKELMLTADGIRIGDLKAAYEILDDPKTRQIYDENSQLHNLEIHAIAEKLKSGDFAETMEDKCDFVYSKLKPFLEQSMLKFLDSRDKQMLWAKTAITTLEVTEETSMKDLELALDNLVRIQRSRDRFLEKIHKAFCKIDGCKIDG